MAVLNHANATCRFGGASNVMEGAFESKPRGHLACVFQSGETADSIQSGGRST